MGDQELTSATETDILKTALQFRASSVTATEESKSVAKRLLKQMETAGSNPVRKPDNLNLKAAQTAGEKRSE
jgi:hypothetical protein